MTSSRKRSKHMAATYGLRNQTLADMGFASYQGYLASDLWKSIRTQVLERDQGKCRVCGDAASEVHHLNYKRQTLDGVSLNALLAICRTCHQGAEVKGDRKNTLYEANAILVRAQKAAKKKRRLEARKLARTN